MKAAAVKAELFGYPGAGKTTIARRLRAEGCPGSGLITLNRSFLHRPVRSLVRFAALRPGSGGEPRAELTRVAVRQHATFDRASGSFLLEEGVAEELWRALYWNPPLLRESWWHRFLDYAGPTLVVLDVSPERALDCIRDKPKWGPVNSSLRDEPLYGEHWRNAIAAYETLMERFSTQPGLDLVILNTGELDVEAAAELVRARLGFAATPSPPADSAWSGESASADRQASSSSTAHAHR